MELDLKKEFGASVKQERKRQRLSQEELAEHSCLNRSYIGEIERGSVTPSLVTVAKLSQAFGLTPSVLVSHAEIPILMAIGG